ncbi:hypothetical protein [Rhizobium sp. 21-4511-3d]
MITAGGILLGIIIGGFFICMFAAVFRSSGRLSLEEDYGAPEGALDIHHINIPNASGSKLGVRASFQSSGGG